MLALRVPYKSSSRRSWMPVAIWWPQQVSKQVVVGLAWRGLFDSCNTQHANPIQYLLTPPSISFISFAKKWHAVRRFSPCTPWIPSRYVTVEGVFEGGACTSLHQPPGMQMKLTESNLKSCHCTSFIECNRREFRWISRIPFEWRGFTRVLMDPFWDKCHMGESNDYFGSVLVFVHCAGFIVCSSYMSIFLTHCMNWGT